ncbi:MAG: LuxR C-terminal-related transcriptional regulator [Chloroflexota bacterium]
MEHLDQLSDREQDILMLMAQGRSNQDIADQLFIALTTVKWYNTRIYEKLGVSNRQEAIDRAYELGLLTARPTEISSGNLPTPPTPFIGRSLELREIGSLLQDPNTPIITILAPGGMGKTRLALEVANRQAERFTHGAYFVPLAPVSSPEYVVATIADSIDYPIQKDRRDPEQQLIEYLHNRSMLLILDNFEHLLDSGALVSRIVQAAPTVRVLITSRERLNLHGETVYALGGMRYPLPNTDALDGDAARLFIQSARRARPDFDVTPDELIHLTRICQLTQGMPLGLELAAGWVDVMPLARIADEMQRDIDILESQLRDVPERHRSIRATIDYSWNSLSDSERAIFRKLAIFRGGFTEDAATTIAGANVRVLRRLVNKALIYARPSGRYEIHELLRQYGEEQLEDIGEAEAVHAAHARYFAQLAGDRVGLPSLEFRTIMETDYDNLVTAWMHIVRTADFDTMRVMIDPFHWFLTAYGRNYDGIDLFDKASQSLREVVEQSDNVDHKRFYDYLHVLLAELLLSVNPKDGYELLDRAITALEAYGPSVPLRIAYALRGNLYYENEFSNPELAKEMVNKALAIAIELNEEQALAYLYLLLGNAHLWQRNYEEARRMSEKALAVADKSMWKWDTYKSIQGIIGEINYYTGDYDNAWEPVMASLRVAEQDLHLYSISRARIRLWSIARAQGRLDEMRFQVHEMLRWHRLHGRDWQILGALFGIAVHWFTQNGEYERAIELLSFVSHHPLTARTAKREIEMFMDDLRRDIDLTPYEAAWSQSLPGTLDTVVDNLLDELDTGRTTDD